MEHYELYHGTKRENVLKIIDSQKFIVNEDEENKLFLGKGAYFYLFILSNLQYCFQN